VFSAQVGAAHGGAPAQLFRVRATGGGLDQITTGRKTATEPAFSPDGKQIVFVRLGSGIFRMNQDGSGLRRLTSGARDIYPVWSPDGKRIAFLRPFRTQWRVFTMSPSGTAERRLAGAPPAGRPSWTPNGQAILVPAGGDLVQIHPGTGQVQRYFGLTLDLQTTQTATVSPDGRTVVYIGPRLSTGAPDCGEGRCPQYALYQARVSSPHRPRRILNDTGPAGWSPDSRTIAFVARGVLNLRTVASGKTTTISPSPHLANGDAPPAWQPR
jgi:Tol biopolymer transport system component